MPNQFVNLPAPVGNGVGTAVDVSSFGALKSIVVAGNAQATITIEVNNDSVPNGTYAPIASFQNSGQISLHVAARWMRMRVSGYNPYVGGTPTCDVGGTDGGTLFASLDVPAGNGVGTAIDTTALGPFKSVQIGDTFRGSVVIEVSEDGTTEWGPLLSFQNPGLQSVIAAAKWMRVRRNGVPQVNPGTPIVNVGATNDVGGGDEGVAISAGTQSAATGTVIFSNSNGVSFGMDASVVTAQVTPETPFGISAGTQSVSTGTLIFSNSGNVSFGMDGSQTITASANAILTISAGITNATGPGISFSNGGNVTFGLSGNTITASVQTVGGTASGVGISAGTQQQTSGVVQFLNSNGVTFGMSNSSQVTASVPAETPFGVSAGTQSVSTGTVRFSNSNGVTFGMAGSNTITASVSPETPFALSAGSQSVSTGTVSFANGSGVTFGMAGSNTITASVAPETPFGISAGSQSVSTGTLIFSNSNGVTFGMSGSNTLTASYSQSTSPAALQVNAVTNGPITAGTIVFSNSNNVSFGLAGSTITATVTAAATQSTAPGAIAAGSQTATSGTVVFSNSNGVTFGMSGSSQVTASYSQSSNSISVFYPHQQLENSWNSIQTMSLQHVTVPAHIHVTQAIAFFHIVQNSQSSGQVSFSVGIYSLTGSTASLVSSAVRQISWTSGSSPAQSDSQYAAVSGIRFRTIALDAVLVPGDYLFAYHLQTVNNATCSVVGSAGIQAPVATFDGVETSNWMNGFWNATFTSAMPSSFTNGDANYNRSGNNCVRFPYMQFFGTF